MWIIDLKHILIAMIVILVIGVIFTYLISCKLYHCWSRKVFKNYLPYIVLVIGGIAVFGHLIAFAAPISGRAGVAVVTTAPLEGIDEATRTSHSELELLLNTVIGAILAFIIAWLISNYIL